MSLVITDTVSTHQTLSTRLVYELSEPRSTLRATTDRSGDALVIHAGGEIDGANEDTWRHLVSEAAGRVAAPGPFVVDVTDVDFMGCCAFTVLADEADRCRQRNVKLRLVSNAAVVRRIVRACGYADALPIHPTVDHALSAEPSRG